MNLSKPTRMTAVAAVFALGLTACGGGGGGEPESSGNGGGDPTGQPGGSYSATITEPTFLAPSSNCYESECSKVVNLIQEPLLNVDPESGEVVYDGLLESVESDDSTVWTIKIKPGLKFQNGEDVNAESFIRAWEYSSNPKNAQATAGFLSHIKGSGKGKSLTGVKAVDDQTLEVTLNNAFSQFPQMMSYTPAFAPMAQECLDDVKACNEEPIGTGPYMMDGAWKHDQSITVTKWPDYQGDTTAVADTIEFQMFTDGVAAWRDFQNGGVDIISPLDPTVYLEAKGQLGDKIIEEPTATLTYLGLPVNEPPFDNPQVRQAISMSIDRDQIIEQVLNGNAFASTDIVTPPIPGSRDDACNYCTYDPEQAKQLLEDSGVDPAGQTIDYYFNADAGHDGWVEAAARQVQENLGFDYKLNSQEWAKYLTFLDGKKFTGPFRLGWSLDYPSPENYVRPIVGTNGDSNYTGYSNPELDKKLVEGDKAETLDEAISLYQEADDMALEDMPILPMWSGQSAVASSDQVGDVRYDVGEGEVAFNEVSVTQ